MLNRTALTRLLGVFKYRTTAIYRLTERVDDTAEHALIHTERENLTGRLHHITLLNAIGITENNRTDKVLFKVKCDTGNQTLLRFKRKHFLAANRRQTGNLRDTVTNLNHTSDNLLSGLY